MSHISKQELTKKAQEQITKQFEKLIKEDKRKASKVLDELLTDTEKLMLAKRLTVITLLGKKYSAKSISKYLKMSSSSVRRLRTGIVQNKYPHIAKIKLNNMERRSILKLIVLFMDPRLMTGKRWQVFNEIMEW